MKKIVIDTNFLMIPYKFRVDIFSEFNRICSFNYGLFVFEQTIGELKKIIATQPGKDKKAAEFGLNLIKLKNIGVIPSKERDADSAMLSSMDKDAIIATQDAILKKRLLEKGASLIILRQKKYLQFAGGKVN